MYTNEYDEALSRMQARFSFNIKNGTEPLFTTDVPNLWNTYLDSFGVGPLRQYHTCHACRQFIERYGNLVTIDSSGITRSPLWHENDATYIYKPAFAALANRVRRAKVTGVFLSSDKVWGTPETGVWHHFAITPPRAILHGYAGTLQATLTAEQAMAEKREDYKAVMRALTEFTLPHLELALTILRTDALYRSEKVLGQAEWLHNLHIARAAAFGAKAKSNVVWRAVATAPSGFCHPRSSMIGTLLEDIAAGLEFEHVSIPEAVLNAIRYHFSCEPDSVSIHETTAGELRTINYLEVEYLDLYVALHAVTWSTKVYDVRDGASRAVYTVDGSLLWKK